MIISIEGMDGVGKTTVAKKIERDLKLKYVKKLVNIALIIVVVSIVVFLYLISYFTAFSITSTISANSFGS